MASIIEAGRDVSVVTAAGPAETLRVTHFEEGEGPPFPAVFGREGCIKEGVVWISRTYVGARRQDLIDFAAIEVSANNCADGSLRRVVAIHTPFGHKTG
jgi:hypothetical protein